MARPTAIRYLMSFSTPQPNMTGIARKNVNSAAAVREQPHSMPPMMVEPERDVPGMMASIWKQPIFSDVFQSISSTVRTRNRAISASSPSSPGSTSGTGRAWAPRGRRGARLAR